MPLLREFQTLLQHPVAVSDRSFVYNPLLLIVELDRIHAVCMGEYRPLSLSPKPTVS